MNRLIAIAVMAYAFSSYTAVIQQAPMMELVPAAAEQKFEQLWQNVDKIASFDSVFWQLAVAFQSMLDYQLARGFDISETAEKAFTLFDAKTVKKEWWYDDYTEYILLFTRIAQHSKGDIKKKAITYAEQCYKLVRDNAPFMWERANDKLKSAQQPRFALGIYNGPLEASDVNSGLNGIQNSVTNTSYLASCLGLFLQAYHEYLAAPNEELAEKMRDYWQSVEFQLSWFNNWFDYGLMNSAVSKQGNFLIEERVCTYVDGSVALYYTPNRFWIGDQAFMLKCFYEAAIIVELLANNNPLKLDYHFAKQLDFTALAERLRKGVAELLVGTDGDLVPYSTTNGDLFPFGDFDDYFMGPDTYVRALVTYAKDSLSDSEKKFIRTGAQIASQGNVDINDVSEFDVKLTNLAKIVASMNIGDPALSQLPSTRMATKQRTTTVGAEESGRLLTNNSLSQTNRTCCDWCVLGVPEFLKYFNVIDYPEFRGIGFR